MCNDGIMFTFIKNINNDHHGNSNGNQAKAYPKRHQLIVILNYKKNYALFNGDYRSEENISINIEFSLLLSSQMIVVVTSMATTDSFLTIQLKGIHK